MEISEFDFDLPEALIALRPLHPRPASRLLVAEGGQIHDAHVRDLSDWLQPGDLLVLNDTRVIPARLFGHRDRASPHGPGRARIEVTLLRRTGSALWQALARPAKRLAPGDIIQFEAGLAAEVAAKGAAGEVSLAFDRAGTALDQAIAATGVMPLPPYIAQRRPADDRDRADYQTVFAAQDGSVAAPTASLHFDQPLLEAIAAQGILTAKVTLHVGAGTFLPVKTENPKDHEMHGEWGEITSEAADAINAARAAGGRIIPVGTTALRLIESAARDDATLAPFRDETALYILPGHRFRIADGLMTNFHLPRSTLFMLVSALMGTARMREIYAHAIARRYRFYSYGDSSLLLPPR